MFKKNINIQADNSVFRVGIPLIKNLERYSDKIHT